MATKFLYGDTQYLWDLRAELASCHHFCAQNFEVAHTYLQILCTPLLGESETQEMWFVLLTVDKHEICCVGVYWNDVTLSGWRILGRSKEIHCVVEEDTEGYVKEVCSSSASLYFACPCTLGEGRDDFRLLCLLLQVLKAPWQRPFWTKNFKRFYWNREPQRNEGLRHLPFGGLSSELL